MSEKRRGLGRGIGALIPSMDEGERPSDIFFPPRAAQQRAAETSRTVDMDAERSGRPGGIPETADSRAGRVATNGSARTVSPATPGAVALTTAEPRRAAARRTVRTPVPPMTAASPPEPASAGSPAEEPELKHIPGIQLAELPVANITPNPRQPREVFDEEYLEELAASIREVGVLQPIVVRPAAEGSEAEWQLIMGERRLRAAGIAGLEMIPAVIRETEDSDLLRDALLENLHRANLNPLEEASAYQQLLEDFECTQEELARRVARSRPQISNTLRLLKLPPLVQRRVAAGILSAGHARALLGLDDGAAMERLAQRIVAEGLSVRTTEELVALGEAPMAPEMRRRPRISQNQGELEELATRLTDRFDTRVKVSMGARRGRITVDFASVEDLDRILGVLAPGESVPTSPGHSTAESN